MEITIHFGSFISGMFFGIIFFFAITALSDY